MKLVTLFVFLLLMLTLSGAATAQFSSGSDGSDGPLLIKSASGTVTLNVPEPDGIFNFTTITIEQGATLRFNRNARNTPVYFLATGDVLIQGTINVSGGPGYTGSGPLVGGKGGPGGFDGGMPGLGGSQPGPGKGPGAGAIGGKGVYNLPPGVPNGTHVDGKPYGSPLLVPLLGGSGGGGTAGNPGAGGGGGGGAILIASSTRIHVGNTGVILSEGGQPNSVAGSSGAIRLVAPIVSGNGSGRLDVSGVNGYGSAGRIRIDTIDRRELNLNYQPISALSVGGFMRVFPEPTPRLDIIHAAGSDIQEGLEVPVTVTLPINSPASQQVTVQARDFTGQVPIRVVLTPDSGNAVIQDATIDMTLGNPSSVNLMMDFPANTPTDVRAYTR